MKMKDNKIDFEKCNAEQKHAMKKARSLILQPIQKELQLISKGYILEKVSKQEKLSPSVRTAIS